MTLLRAGLPALLLLLCCVTAGAQENREGAADRSCARAGEILLIMPAPSPGDTLHLPHRLLAASSLSVGQDSLRFLPGRDYLLEPISGEIYWIGPRPPGDELAISYRHLAWPLPGEWRHLSLTTRGDTVAVREARRRSRADLPAGASLQIGGSKTFALEFGNRQDVSLSQSLDLTIRGQLAPDVKVRAVLTDRNLPLQPEGTTAELADLDQVFIEVAAPWGRLNLGDMQVEERRFGFTSHTREMEGALVHAGRSEGARATAAIGRSVGVARSITLAAQDGKQGPYVLVSRRPGEEALLVAGSERIWLDGEALRRGENGDYTVDYAAGELWFTSRQPIQSTQEIRVDFQVRQGGFDRSYYWVQSAAGDSTRSFATCYLREADDPDRSPLIPLGDDEREVLAQVGDSAQAVEGGVQFLGLGQGDYELVEVDTLEAPIFFYMGEDAEGNLLGSYEVDFTLVGEREGDYRDSTLTSGETVYVFEGYQRADYLPGRRLPLPESRDVLAVKGEAQVGAGLSLAAEGAFSWHDQNVLSGLDDGDNHGRAMSVAGNWRLGELWGGSRESAHLTVHYRNVDETFSSSEPLDPAFYHRRWNATQRQLDGRDRRGGASLTVQPGRGWRLQTGWERLRARGDFDGERFKVRSERRGAIHGSAEMEWGTTDAAGVAGREQRLAGRLGWDGPLRLEAGYRAEDLLRGNRGDETGDSYRTIDLRGDLPRAPGDLQVRTQARWRWDYDHVAGARERQGVRRLLQAEIDLIRPLAQAQVLIAHRAQTGPDGSAGNETNLANWTTEVRSANRLFAAKWRGNLTVEEALLRSERLVSVDPGAGHYDSLGHYVGIGDYELYYATADSALETRLESALRMSMRPLVAVVQEDSRWTRVEMSLFGRIDLGTPQELRDLLGSSPSLFRGEGPVRRHNGLLRGELAYNGTGRAPAPRIRWEERRSTQRSTTGFVRERRARDLEGEVRWTPRAGLTTLGGVGWLREGQGVSWAEVGGNSSYDRHVLRSVFLEGRWRLWGPLTARLRSETGWDEFQPEDWRQRSLTGLGGLVFDLRRSGRLEAVFERDWLDPYRPQSRLYADARPGWRLTLGGSLRPKPGYSATLSLRIDRREGQDRIVAGKMEMRAFF